MTAVMVSREKHQDAAVDMGVDFVRRLQGAETLASAPTLVVKSASHGVIADLTVGTVVISGTQVAARISGGTALEHVDADRWETRYTLEATVVTSSGETESEIVELVVYDSVENTG